MKKVSLYVNKTKDEASFIASKVKESLIKHNYIIDNINPDIVIGFGGDGTLIHFLNSVNYSADSKYLGVNCGTLGFMQDFDVSDADEFVRKIPTYIEKRYNFISLKIPEIHTNMDFLAINDFYIASSNDSALRMKVYIDGEFLENYMGTGMLFASTVGSTARNLSSVGAILFPEIETLQMTPGEATFNKSVKILPKSICMPKDTIVKLIPEGKIKILSDGIKVFDNKAKEIEISYSEKYLTKLVDKNLSFTSRIRNKLL